MARNWLTLLLRINAVLLMLASPAIVMPFAWMQSIHSSLGMGTLVHSPVIEYLARSISLLYTLFGVATWMMANDTERYGPMIRLWGVAAIVCGAVLFAIDLVIEMPVYWLLAEGPYLIPLGLLICWLQMRVEGQNGREQPEG